MSSPIDLTGDLDIQIPSWILEDWLPIRNKSVFHLFAFNQYPANKTHYTKPKDFVPMLHGDHIPFFKPATLPHFSIPVNPSVSKTYQDAIRSAQHPVNSITLVPHPGNGGPVMLPVWIFEYWREMELALSYLEKWKGVMKWLQSYSELPATAGHCHKLMTALSFFPWSGNNVAVKDIACVLSGSSSDESYLASLHIDHMIGRISEWHGDLHGQVASRRHVFMTVDVLATIIAFYGTKPAPSKVGNHFWGCLMVIENQIVNGEVDSVCGICHLPGHWTSVVFDIQQGHILYGDSLNHTIPSEEHKAFTQWIQRLNTRSRRNMDDNPISIHPLPTSFQNDSISCGLLALNALSHHYLNQPLLSPNKISLACARMEIALDLLSGNTVCPTVLNMQYFNLA